MSSNTIFSTFQTTYIPIIEEKLSTFLPQSTPDNRSYLLDAVNYSLQAGGKRIRPLLTIASYQLFRHNPEPIYPLAIAIEMIHTYSLIHDDLPAMDNDDLRRGKKTCHKAFDEATAILAGDTLNAYAFELMAQKLPKTFSDQSTLQAILKLAETCGINGLTGGQTLDLQATNHLDPKLADKLTQMHDLKTGALIQACVILPAILCEVTSDEKKALSKYGYYLGRLFQITDDILDVTQSSKTLGKTAGKDVIQKKLTYVSLFGLEEAKQKAIQTATLAKTSLHDLEYDASLFEAFIDKICFRIQ